VAGESNYTDAIRKVFSGNFSSEWSEAKAVAQLVPEPKNKYDRNAVQVLIYGAVVGYLPKEDAARYAPVLSKIVAQGWLPQVAARVLGAVVSDYEYDSRGRGRDTTRFAGSVMLDLAEPHMLVPANLPPDAPHVMLPRGGAIQVTGEEAYLANLVPTSARPARHGSMSHFMR
jgi:collagen type III alpha